MTDTERTLSELQALFADNTARGISPQDLRDFLVSIYGELAHVVMDSAELSDADSASTSTWEDWGSPIDLGDPGREVKVRGLLTASALGDSSKNISGRVRVSISLDGGSTWDEGLGPWEQMDDTPGSNRRHAFTAQHYRTGTPTGAVQVKAQKFQSGGTTADIQFNEGTISALMIPYDS